MKIDPAKTYVATIETDAGKMVAELYPKIAPQTVNSFVFLAREGFYEGTIFHRVIPGFMIQGGDPTGTGEGGPGYSLKAEFNDTKHDRGVLSMARTARPRLRRQPVLRHARPRPHLDNKYTAFGKVTKGLEVIDKIVDAPRDAQRPAGEAGEDQEDHDRGEGVAGSPCRRSRASPVSLGLVRAFTTRTPSARSGARAG